MASFNDRYDSSAIDSDSDWESDGHDEMVRSFQRVPYTKPPARASLISIEMAQGGMIPGNPGTLPTNPGPPPSDSDPLASNSGARPANASGAGRHTLRRTSRITAKSFALTERELSNFLSRLSMDGSGEGSGSQANSDSSLGASTSTAATSQSNSNPDDGCLMMANQRPRKVPAESDLNTKFLMQPTNTPVFKISPPKVIRQEMVLRELPDSLRTNMIWERSYKHSTANAVLKRRHTAPNMPHLRLRRQRKFSRPSTHMSCQELQMMRNGYNDRGW